MAELKPGKYVTAIQTRGVRESRNLEGQPLEAYATFMIDGEKVYWNGLILTREGSRNSKTMKCLKAMGCVDEDVVTWLGADVIGRDVQLTLIEKPNRNGEMKLVVDWINQVGGSDTSDSVIEKLKASGLGGDKETPIY